MINPVYLCRHDQIYNKFPDNTDLVIMDYPEWKWTLVMLCNKYFGEGKADIYAPSHIMIFWLNAIDISKE